MKVKAIVTDIEGTTTSIRFVHEVLFPYAKKELPAYVREHGKETAIAELLGEASVIAGVPESDTEAVIAALLQWIEEDKKIKPLKALQGHIWKAGYQEGDFTGHVYSDTHEYLRKWQEMDIALYVYSSGSVPAQKLLFGHSDAGDLRPLFAGYFDTGVGHKAETGSYVAIAESVSLLPQDILFLSDVVAELDAAAEAGMLTTQLVRDAHTQAGTQHRIAKSFAEVDLHIAEKPKETP